MGSLSVLDRFLETPLEVAFRRVPVAKHAEVPALRFSVGSNPWVREHVLVGARRWCRRGRGCCSGLQRPEQRVAASFGNA